MREKAPYWDPSLACWKLELVIRRLAHLLVPLLSELSLSCLAFSGGFETLRNSVSHHISIRTVRQVPGQTQNGTYRLFTRCYYNLDWPKKQR